MLAQQQCVAGKLSIPGGDARARGAAGADPCDQRVALGEYLRVDAAVGATSGPDGGHELVEMGAANGGRALEQLEPIGQEDAQQRPGLDVEQALDRRPVGAHALGLARLKSDAQLVRAGIVGESHDDAGRLRAEAHQLALVAGPRRTAGATKVERLEQVRLAHAVRPMDHRETLAEMGFGASVGAEVAQLHADHAHRPRPSSRVQPDRHDEVHKIPGIGRLDQAGAEWADQLQDELV